MRAGIVRKNRVTAALVAAVIFICICMSGYRFFHMDFHVYDNEARVLVSVQKDQIQTLISEKGTSKTDNFKKGKYPYMVIDLEGTISYTDTEFDKKIGEKVNVQEMLQSDRSFQKDHNGQVKKVFVLDSGGSVSGFAVFLIPEEDLILENLEDKALYIFLPMLIGGACAIIIVLMRAWYCEKRMLGPIGEISFSAKNMIRGNYDYEVVRTYGKTVREDEMGDLIYSFELMRDELKQKQMKEEVLKKSQQELISCISHDLKTPISTIKAYSEGIRDGIARTEQDKSEYIGIIIRKTNLLIEMIEELLEYSNTQLNQMEILRKEIYFSPYFKEVMEEIGGYVRQRGLRFSYENRLEDRIVCIDKKRITEVFYNLVENSMKYSGEDGFIKIIAEMNQSDLLIRVQDNGRGIGAEDIPFVFDKFYRGEKSRTFSIPGSGLGLSICKYIVEYHEGEIYCKSSLETGCEIGFTLK